MAKEETHDLISFCLGEFLPKLLTFSEAKVRAFLFMRKLVHGGLSADRSLSLGVPSRVVFILFPL